MFFAREFFHTIRVLWVPRFPSLSKINTYRSVKACDISKLQSNFLPYQRNLTTGIPKVVGSIPTVFRHIFQLARCGHKLRVTPQTSFSSKYITLRYVKILISLKDYMDMKDATLSSKTSHAQTDHTTYSSVSRALD